MRPALVAMVVAACGHPAAPSTPPPPPAATPAEPAQTMAVEDKSPDDDKDEAKLAAIQKAMNELDGAAQGCWAAVAVERFDVEGELAAQVEIGPPNIVTIVSDSVRNLKLATCMKALLAQYGWAPPLHGQTIQLPFKFTAPDGQSVIDRRLVPWVGQGKVSVAVLLDENNTGNAGASMFEVAIAAGATTEARYAERSELWYFLGAAHVKTGGATYEASAGDMLFVPYLGAREVIAGAQDLHAVVVMTPGGREGAARAGALPTRKLAEIKGAPVKPVFLPAAAAKTYGPATIYAENATIHSKELAASILELPAKGYVPEHAHAKETELLYVLSGAGTLTIAGTEVEVTPTSVIQIPPGTKHAFGASAAVRAVQIYTPAGPEQRFKK